MLREIFRFELRYQLRQPLFILVFLLMAFLAFMTIVSDAVTVGGGGGNVHRNAPLVVIQLLTAMTVLGVFVITAFVASAALRDFEQGTDELFFSRPIKPRHYLLGRFLGAMVVAVLIYLGPALGILLGSFMPWLEPERLGPTTLAPYLFAFAVMVLPNLLFTGALFFSLAALRRSLFATYMGVVGFFVAFTFAGELLDDLETRTAGALVDPFGFAAFADVTRYWTVAERNTAIPEVVGTLLANRLLWSAVGVVVLALTLWRFDPSRAIGRAKKREKRRKAREAAERALTPAAAGAGAGLVRVTPSFGGGTVWRQLWAATRFEAELVFRSLPFLVILAFGIFNLLGNTAYIDALFGTPVYPVTHLMLQALAGAFVFLLVIIITFYSGEMIWRERSLKLDEVVDATPAPSGVFLGAKVLALCGVAAVFLVCGVLALVGFQLWNGYTRFEPGLYLAGAAEQLYPFLLIAVLACFLQVLANGKFVGYLLMILYLLSNMALSALHFDHRLYRYAATPPNPYSDMNAFGHFVWPTLVFDAYWTFGALLLAGLALLFWVRSRDTGLRGRFALARERFRGAPRTLVLVGAMGFFVLGGFIFYNTNVLNEYLASDAALDRQAEYEKQYRKYIDEPLPRITAVATEVDIYPADRRMEARGTYRLRNDTGAPLAELHLSLPTRMDVLELDLPDHEVTLDDEVLGYRIVRLARPLAPGEESELGFHVVVDREGFVNADSDTSLVENGTFFNSRQYFPVFGYQPGAQIVDRNERRKRGLEPVDRMAKLEDTSAYGRTFLSRGSDWIDFATTVSTSADQVAIAPGTLVDEWTEDGRHYFRYEMQSPILDFYSYLSARWDVARDVWTDADGDEVRIAVYHHPTHTMNVARMIDAVKKSLDYFSREFGPYQHRQVRIIEFPRYARFAQSFPNTIPFSESIGFIARLDEDDPEAIDYPFYVTAHEVAHQWWPHQAIVADVQGSSMLSESLSQYSALMVMEEEYGREHMRRFLKHELDSYLQGRSGELVEELPLIRVENQPYIHYRKGSVALYALRDYLGEDAVNQALREYLEEHRFGGPPFPTTLDFLAALRRHTPERHAGVVTDLLETITLFDNRAEDATAEPLGDGRFKVTLAARTTKLRADGEGTETPIAVDDWIDVGIFAAADDGAELGPPLYLEKRHVEAGESTFEVVVDAPPAKAGIDPYNKLIDRNSEDNVVRVTVGD